MCLEMTLSTIIVIRTYIADPGAWLIVIERVNNVVIRFNLFRYEVLPGFYLFANKSRTEHTLLFMILFWDFHSSGKVGLGRAYVSGF